MALLNLKVENRNNLYFNKYKYRGRAQLLGASYIRFCRSPIDIYEKIDFWKTKSSMSASTRWVDFWNRVDSKLLNSFMSWKETIKDKNISIRIEANIVAVFSNDLQDIINFRDAGFNKEFDVTEINVPTAIAVADKNVLFFKKEPKYKYRTYFKQGLVPKNFLEDIKSFSSTYSASAKVSYGLLRRANETTPHSYVWSNYYIDYNDNGIQLILHMLFGSMVHKSYSLQKYP